MENCAACGKFKKTVVTSEGGICFDCLPEIKLQEPYCLHCQAVMTGDLAPGQGDDFDTGKYCTSSCEEEHTHEMKEQHANQS